MSIYSRITQQEEDEEKKRQLKPSQVAGEEQKKKSIYQSITQPAPAEIEKPKKPTFGEKVKTFGKELVSGFKVGVPQAVSAIKKTGSDILGLMGKAESLKAGTIADPFKQKAEIGEAFSKEAEKLKQIAINDFKKSNLMIAELPIVDQGSFVKNVKDPAWLGRNIGQSLPNLVASLGVSTVTTALTANPAVGLLAGFGSSYSLESGFAYMDAKEFGADEETANKVAAITGVANGILDSLPFGRIISKMGKVSPARRLIVKEIVSGVLKQTALESTTESLQEIVANAVARAYDKDRNLFAGVPESFVIGGLLGAGTSVAIETPLDIMHKTSDVVKADLDKAVKLAEAKPEDQRSLAEKDLIATNKGEAILRETPKETITPLPPVIEEEIKKKEEFKKKPVEKPVTTPPPAKVEKPIGESDKNTIDFLTITAKDARDRGAFVVLVDRFVNSLSEDGKKVLDKYEGKTTDDKLASFYNKTVKPTEVKPIEKPVGEGVGGVGEVKIKINEKQLQDTGWTDLTNGNTKASLEDRFVDEKTLDKYFDGEMPYTISTLESKVSKTGSATDMVKQIQDYAGSQGKPIIITPDARPSRITETGTKTPLNQQQLESWYEKLGFKKIISGEEKGAMYWKPQPVGGVEAKPKQAEWIIDTVVNNKDTPKEFKDYLIKEGGISEEMADKALELRTWVQSQSGVVTNAQIAAKLAEELPKPLVATKKPSKQPKEVKKPPVKRRATTGLKKAPKVTHAKSFKILSKVKVGLPIIDTMAKVYNGDIYMTDLTTSLVAPAKGEENGLYEIIGEDLKKNEHLTKDDIAEYPDIPDVGKEVGKILNENLADGLLKARNFVDKSGVRPMFNGVRFEFKKGKLRLVSTDGYQLFIEEKGIKMDKPMSFIISDPTAISNLLGVFGDSAVSISRKKVKDGADKIIFTDGKSRIVATEVVGDYPSYQKLAPEIKQRLAFDKKQAKGAIKKLRPYAKDSLNTVEMRVEDNTLFLKSGVEGRDKEVGLKLTKKLKDVKGKEGEVRAGTLIMPVRMHDEKFGKGGVGALNLKYIDNILKQLAGGDVYMSFAGKLNPFHFSDKVEKVIETAKEPKPAKLPELTPKEKKLKKWVQSGSAASMDRFADLKNLTESQGQVKAIEFPELLTIAKELMGETPGVKRPRFRPSLGGYPYGLFKSGGKGKIILNPIIFKTPDQAAKTFAHEIGHLSDYLPQKTIKRGNLISRIASLRFGMKQYFAGYKKQEQIDNLTKERKALTEKRKGTEGAENKQLKQKIMALNRQIKELKKNPKLQNKEIMEELKRITQLWKPFDEEKASDSFVKYRYAPAELYADAISVLLNDPVMLKENAPKFWKGFFEFMNQKPEVSKNFHEIWNLLNKGEDAVFGKRQEDIRGMFQKGEDQSAILREEKLRREKDYVFRLKYELNDKNQRMIDNVKKAEKEGKKVSDDSNPVFWLEEQNYVGGVVKEWVESNIQPIYRNMRQAGVTWEDFGEALFHERVINERGAVKNPIGQLRKLAPEVYAEIEKELPRDIETRGALAQLAWLKKEYGELREGGTGQSYYNELLSILPKGIANPLGFDADTSKSQLGYLEKTLGKEKWGVLKSNLLSYRKAMVKITDMAEKSELYTEKMLDQIKANPAYATFQVLDYLSLSIPASIKQQIGTLKEIANPADSTIIKSISVIYASERNIAKRKTIDHLKEFHEDQVQEARTIWTGEFHKPIESRNRKEEALFTLLEDGKVKGYYVDPYIASSFDYMTTGHVNAVISVLRFFNGKLFRPLFITYNPGFQSFNLIRDFVRTYKNIPGMTVARTFKRYFQALPASIARGFGVSNKTISEMEKAKILNITYNDIIAGQEGHDKQIDAIITRAGLSPLVSTKKNFFIKQFTKENSVLSFIEKLGNIIETLPKVAGYKELNGKLPPKALASFIRSSVGSPDFLRKGAGYKWYNEVFLFSNAIKEGIKSDVNIAVSPKTRSGFWFKTAKITFLPKILMFGALMGIFGDELKKMLEDVSEYDKTNYTIVPIGKDQNGLTTYLRIPQDETGRVLGGILWKAMRIGQNNQPIMKDVSDLISFTGGQIPGLSPTIGSLISIAQFMSGKNPYDSFRGRNVIPDDAFEAGGMYALKPFVSWQLKQLGGGIFMKGYVSSQPTDDKTWVQKIVEMPLASNIIGRWIKVSNYGQREKNEAIVKGIKREKATQRIEEREILNEAIKEYQSGTQNMTNRNRIVRKLVEDIVGKPKSPADKAKITNLRKKFKIGIIKGEADQNINSIISAQSNAEKVELLKQLKDQMSDSEYQELFTTLRKEKIISKEVIKQLKRDLRTDITDSEFKLMDIFKVREAHAAELISPRASGAPKEPIPYRLSEVDKDGYVNFYYPSGAYSRIKEEDIPKYATLTQKNYGMFGKGKYPDNAPNWLAPKQITGKGKKATHTPYNKKIKEVFGDIWHEATRVLRYEDESGVHGENKGLQADIDASNEGYDKALDSKTAPGDVLGEDNKWHSQDRGLYRINSRHFTEGELNRRKKLLDKVGIDTSSAENAWEDMRDPDKNIDMAKIIYDEQGWCAWYAAPVDLCPKNADR